MQPAQTAPEIIYPEGDGNPMAETELHLDWMFRIRQILQWRYRAQRVYIGCNLLVYYERGSPARSVAPDVFVAFDCDPGRRRTFKIWDEGKAPDVVFEVTSISTRRDDEFSKRRIYEAIGVAEYFLYDPTADYLDPPLQGYWLEEGEYRRLPPDESGAVTSRLMNVTLRLQEGELAMFDGASGERLLSEVEAEKAAREAAQVEIAQLQAEIDRLRGSSK